MLIRGEWFLRDDMVARPVVRARVDAANGGLFAARFLVDSGADRTVFSNALLTALDLPVNPPPPGYGLVGVGGTGAFVLVATILTFRHDAGGVARFHPEYAAFTDPLATDMSILGRDVLDHFDVILSRRRDEVLLLAPNHQYRVLST
jgi:hypothetical protein